MKITKVETNNEFHELGILDDISGYKYPYRGIKPPKQWAHSAEFLRKRCDFSIPDKLQDEPVDWNQRIDKLEKYFAGIKISIISMELNPFTTIYDIPGFIESHLTLIKTCNRNSVNLPCLERLEKLTELLQEYQSSKRIDHLQKVAN